MSISPTSVTGVTLAQLTSPGYNLTPDNVPSGNGKQWAILSLTGTQTGVDAHTASKPFTLSVYKPLVAKTLPQPNPVTGIIKNVPKNTYKFVARKGANSATGVPSIILGRAEFDVPAGVDTNDPQALRAFFSMFIGALYQERENIITMMLTNTN